MNFPFYKQPDIMDCGPTCLRMVAKFHGCTISLQALREKTQIGKEGVNLLGISEAAESIGFKTQSLILSYETLTKDATLPAIIHWKQNHFVVLYKVKKNKFYVADPAIGLIDFTSDEFKANWLTNKNEEASGGIAMLLDPTALLNEQEEIDKSTIGKHGFNNIFNYLLPYKKFVTQLFIGLGVASLIQLILPFLTQSVVDTGINTANLHFVYIILLAQIALFAGRLAIEFVRGWILLHISTRINISILTDFLIKLMKLPVSYFDSKHTGDILQRMNDHSRIESFLTGSSLSVLFSLVNLFVFSIVLAMFNVNIFVVFAIASVMYAVWVIFFLKKRKVLDYKHFEVAAKEQSITIQLIQGMQEIKLNGAERSMRWTWERLQVRLFGLSMKGLSLNQWQQAGGFFINEGKNIFITFLSAKAVIDGQMTLGTMLAVQYIIGQLNSPIEQMIGFVQSWQNARISMDRLNEIHGMEDEEPGDRQFHFELPLSFQRNVSGGNRINPGTLKEVTSSDHIRTPEKEISVNDLSVFEKRSENISSGYLNTGKISSININNLSFTYPGAGNEPVLRDISLSIPKGKTTAIVGISGSGKTTLLKLLLKFYEPQKGEIKLGDVSLHSISHKMWRRHCGVVMQESFIFSDTIAKNISVGRERIDMDKLRHAAEVANVRDFIENLPLEYNTNIGAEGMGISMGQKQRLLIARSVYRDPDFIFFDEATNSLDANNEMQIIQNLESFFNGRTVVVVAHRLSTVKHAHQIILLNNGEISERGTHQELVNLKGEYFRLVKNQLELGN